MDQFNVRIALHGASAAIYEMMADAVVRMGGLTTVDSPSGTTRRLRPGEYVFRSNLDAHGLLRNLEAVLRTIWIDSAIRVTGEKESCSSGVEPVPEPPSESDELAGYSHLS
jgi:hypothetical protein